MNKDPLVLLVYDKCKDIVDKKSITTNDIANIITTTIPIVETLVNEKNKGAYKKKVVITVLTLLVDNSELEDEEKKDLHLLIDTAVPPMIDAMVKIANGEIKFNSCKFGCCVIN